MDALPPPFEGVVNAATGVGKTYILAAATEYYAGLRHRNFAVVTPGRTILEKTVNNFMPGHPKSLLGAMSVRPVVITSENFATAAMRAAMDDPDEVKLYIFTVQALIRPTSKTHRLTHKFQEGLGEAFYGHLLGLDDLVVFADEHHVYYGKAFSTAVRDLTPRALIGLTATPHRRTTKAEIIYRYPLAAAIADQYVKTPVIVGRRDDRADPETKLRDGLSLLELKAEAVRLHRQEHGEQRVVNPVMLVVAQTIEDAEEYGEILRSPDFMGGEYSEKVLVVHSKQADEALAELEKVEAADSPVRVIISVGMLKEGWDVANVYVIASMRASVSEILTEQTLGRGLRLPFGAYTGIEILDTLEVLAHERYEELLRRAGVINEQFIDYRTRMVERMTAEGTRVAVAETSTSERPFEILDESPEPGHVTAVGTVEGRERRGAYCRGDRGGRGHEGRSGAARRQAPHPDTAAEDVEHREPLLAGRHHRCRTLPPAWGASRSGSYERAPAPTDRRQGRGRTGWTEADRPRQRRRRRSGHLGRSPSPLRGPCC